MGIEETWWQGALWCKKLILHAHTQHTHTERNTHTHNSSQHSTFTYTTSELGTTETYTIKKFSHTNVKQVQFYSSDPDLRVSCTENSSPFKFVFLSLVGTPLSPSLTMLHWCSGPYGLRWPSTLPDLTRRGSQRSTSCRDSVELESEDQRFWPFLN